jgi:hypothetical protein
MIMAAAMNGWIDGDKAMMESLIAFKHAGNGVLTYFARRGGDVEEKVSARRLNRPYVTIQPARCDQAAAQEASERTLDRSGQAYDVNSKFSSVQATMDWENKNYACRVD